MTEAKRADKSWWSLQPLRAADPAVTAGSAAIDHYIEVAKTAERGLFDQVFVADSPGIWHQGDDESFSRQGRVSHFEPVTLWAALAAVTKHVDFVATASTTYYEPFHVARQPPLA